MYAKNVGWYLVYSPYRAVITPVFKRIWEDSGIRIYLYSASKRFSGTKKRESATPPAKIQLTDVRTVAIFGLLSIGLATSLVFGSLENIRKLEEILTAFIAAGIRVAIKLWDRMLAICSNKNDVIPKAGKSTV